MKKKITALMLVLLLAVVSLSGCAGLDMLKKNVKGNLIGNEFTIYTFDHFGNQVMKLSGQKVGVENNIVKKEVVNEDGSSSVIKDLSSFITNTVDGDEFSQVGYTVMYVEKGLEPLKDFSLSEEMASEGGGSINAVDRNLNKIKNLLGVPKVVLVGSQMGVPIAVFGGKSVGYNVPSDLPKMTKFVIDGKALYVHRATLAVLDSDLIEEE